MGDSRSPAVGTALALLNYRWYTEKELRQRLADKGHPLFEIEGAVAYLREMSYLDDRRFARSWITDRNARAPIGRIKICYELEHKGVSREIIDEVLAEILPEEEEYRLLLTAARKKLAASSRITRNKLAAFLMRRGFSHALVLKACRELDREIEKEYNNFGRN